MWVGITLASLVVLIILVLYIPLDVALHIDVHGKPKFGMRVVWLFGLVSKEVREREKKPEEKRRVPEGKPKPTKRMRGTDILRILRTKGLLGQFKSLLKGIFSHLRIRKLEADFKVGLDDPADTGVLFALIGPAIFFLNRSCSHRIRIQPSFEAAFEGFSHGRIRLRPIQLVPPLLRFTFSLSTIRAIKTLVLTKWKRRK